MQLRTNRSMWKYFLLSLVTFGIYGLVVMTQVGNDINTIATKHDGKKTMNYLLVLFLLTPITLGIAMLVWMHRISARIGNELDQRGVMASFGAKHFWLWCILGSLIVVGPFIYFHKFFKSVNLLAEDYNFSGS